MQKLVFTKCRTTMLKEICKFRTMKNIYMPTVRAVLADVSKAVYDGQGDQVHEVTRLFVPSEIANTALRVRVCAPGAPDIEACMREGEASKALEGVRIGLHTRTMTNRFKLSNFAGQGLTTKSQSILRQVNVRIHNAKLRYRYSRLALRGHGDWEGCLRVLHDDDVARSTSAR
jgi:hypothetical protein